jgi:hypothetical protein
MDSTSKKGGDNMSKILIYVDSKEGTKQEVRGIHYFPFDLEKGVPQEVIDANILVDSVPTPDTIEGKMAVMYVNPQTKELWYEYVDRPLTPEEKIQLLEQENQDLKNRVELMQQAMDELLLGGM